MSKKTNFSKKTPILVVFVIISLLIMSCGNKDGADTKGSSTGGLGGGGLFGRSPDGPTTSSQDHYSGSEGITVGFIENSPPDVVYDLEGTGGELLPLIQVQNKGVFDATPIIYLSGFDPTIIKFRGSDLSGAPLYDVITPALRGKSTLNPEGEYRITELYGPADLNLGGDIDIYKTNLQLTTCYYYETKASPVLCVDPDPFSPLTIRACEPKGWSGGGGQGAPVSVTSVTQQSMPGKISIVIEIANQGQGTILEKSVVQSAINSPGRGGCLGNLKYNQVNRVYYAQGGDSGISISGVTNLQCEPTETVILGPDKKGRIFCQGTVNSQTAYEAPLRITLQYGYLQSWTTPIEIRSTS
ncbi:hypothetical protein ACFL0W_04000 [Nanoarchaeota archaeon]